MKTLKDIILESALSEASMSSKPKTQAMKNFLAKEKDRVVDLSIEDDGVFIYTKSSEWCDDAGSGTFRGDTETKAIKNFYARVRRAST